MVFLTFISGSYCLQVVQKWSYVLCSYECISGFVVLLSGFLILTIGTKMVLTALLLTMYNFLSALLYATADAEPYIHFMPCQFLTDWLLLLLLLQVADTCKSCT